MKNTSNICIHDNNQNCTRTCTFLQEISIIPRKYENCTRTCTFLQEKGIFPRNTRTDSKSTTITSKSITTTTSKSITTTSINFTSDYPPSSSTLSLCSWSLQRIECPSLQHFYGSHHDLQKIRRNASWVPPKRRKTLLTTTSRRSLQHPKSLSRTSIRWGKTRWSTTLDS
jgi:hypothetical protein